MQEKKIAWWINNMIFFYTFLKAGIRQAACLEQMEQNSGEPVRTAHKRSFISLMACLLFTSLRLMRADDIRVSSKGMKLFLSVDSAVPSWRKFKLPCENTFFRLGVLNR